MADRDILIIMPFGGTEGNNSGSEEKYLTEKHCILDFKRIKYLVENKVKVIAKKGDEGSRITYNVEVYNETVGAISPGALRKIIEADILIALMTESNINVIFELAIRNLIGPNFIIITKGDSRAFLPVYLKDWACIRYDIPNDDDNKKILEELDKIADLGGITFSWDDGIIPSVLINTIDDKDNALIGSLQSTLQSLETSPPDLPAHFKEARAHIIKNADPGLILSEEIGWVTYIPYSVVRIKWKKKHSTLGYNPEDMIGEPVVYSLNDKYKQLFNYQVAGFPNPDSNDAITSNVLIENIEECIDHEHLVAFKDDQINAASKIIIKDQYGQAKVPLQFNDKHPTFPNKAYLPCMVGKRTVGNTSSPHAVFLLIAFVEDFFPVGENPNV